MIKKSGKLTYKLWHLALKLSLKFFGAKCYSSILNAFIWHSKCTEFQNTYSVVFKKKSSLQQQEMLIVYLTRRLLTRKVTGKSWSQS